jgi:hypothetical protein
MSTGMAGSFLKGALISFSPSGGALGLPVLPNVIVFQINPETITHAWTEAGAPQPSSDPRIIYSPLAVTGAPGETFSFTLMLDADEAKADILTNPLAAAQAYASGVYARLAALELLHFPTPMPEGSLVRQVSAAADAATQGASPQSSSVQQVPLSQAPIVLLVWGALRIMPVRVTAFSVTERLFDVLLNPTHAEATITLSVLTPDECASVLGPMKSVAQAAYAYTQGVRQSLAVANVDNSAASTLGMLPTPF